MDVTQDYPTAEGVTRLRVVYRPGSEQILHDLWNVASSAQAQGQSPRVEAVLPQRARHLILGRY